MLLLKQVTINIKMFSWTKNVRYSMNKIQSKNYTVGSFDIKKITLSYYSDKNYILDNGIDALALDAWSYRL